MSKFRKFRLPGQSQSKYRNKPNTVDGIRFASKKEANYYCQLKLARDAGEVVCFLMQVPIHFPGGRYIVDFQVFYADGTIEFIDVKGVETKEFKLKKRIVEELYPFEIKTV